jgi:hypothetical protein
MRRFLLILTILDVPGWSQPSVQQPPDLSKHHDTLRSKCGIILTVVLP